MKVQVVMDEKPAVITTDIPTPAVKSSEKKSYNVKYIALAVAAVCIVVAIVGGFVFAFTFHAETTKQIITTHKNFDDGMEEDVEEDVEDNSKLYTVRQNGKTFYILEDPNKSLRLTKRGNICYLAPVSSEDDNHVWTVDKQPIKDRSVMSKRGQELCEDQDVYWAWPSCDNDAKLTSNDTEANKNGNERTKRGFFAPNDCCYTPCGLTCPDGTRYTYYIWGYVLELYYYYFVYNGQWYFYCEWYLTSRWLKSCPIVDGITPVDGLEYTEYVK